MSEIFKSYFVAVIWVIVYKWFYIFWGYNGLKYSGTFDKTSYNIVLFV